MDFSYFWMMGMLTKEKLMATISELPETFSMEDLFERLIFVQKIELGLEQSEKGQVVSTEEARNVWPNGYWGKMGVLKIQLFPF